MSLLALQFVALHPHTTEARNRNPAEIHPDPFRHDFFNSLTREPLVWYSEDSDGSRRFFDGPGTDPQFGQQLRPVSGELVSQMRREQEITLQYRHVEALIQEATEAFAARHYDVVLKKCAAVLESSDDSRCRELKRDAAVEWARDLVHQGHSRLNRGDLRAALLFGREAAALDPESVRAKDPTNTSSALRGYRAALK